MIIFREEATSVLTCFHAGPPSLSWWNWKLEYVHFSGGKKTRVPGERLSGQDDNQQQIQSTYGTWPEIWKIAILRSDY